MQSRISPAHIQVHRSCMLASLIFIAIAAISIFLYADTFVFVSIESTLVTSLVLIRFLSHQGCTSNSGLHRTARGSDQPDSCRLSARVRCGQPLGVQLVSLAGRQCGPHLRHWSHLYGLPAHCYPTAFCLSLVNCILFILSPNGTLTTAAVLLQLSTHQRLVIVARSEPI